MIGSTGFSGHFGKVSHPDLGRHGGEARRRRVILAGTGAISSVGRLRPYSTFLVPGRTAGISASHSGTSSGG